MARRYTPTPGGGDKDGPSSVSVLLLGLPGFWAQSLSPPPPMSFCSLAALRYFDNLIPRSI
jgi:hypothetical protein